MTDTKIWPEISTDWPAPPGPAADTNKTVDDGHRRPARRPGVRLRALLRAPGLLAGRPDGPHDPVVVEDDRSRLAGPRGW